jgi:hypothetical protein
MQACIIFIEYMTGSMYTFLSKNNNNPCKGKARQGYDEGKTCKSTGC